MLMSLLFSSLVWAAPEDDDLKNRRFGMGIAVGAPSGFTGKLYVPSEEQSIADSTIALQFSVGGDLGQVGDGALSFDLIFQDKAVNNIEDGYLISPYWGAGLNFGANIITKSFALGPRVVGGVTVIVPNMPVELYVESAPTFVVYDSIAWSFEGALGARFFF